MKWRGSTRRPNARTEFDDQPDAAAVNAWCDRYDELARTKRVAPVFRRRLRSLRAEQHARDRQHRSGQFTADPFVVAFVADNPGGWLIDCHILEYRAGAMGAQFHVTVVGARAAGLHVRQRS